MSATYFATSGYYPFVKSEFKRYDYDSLRTIAELWGQAGERPQELADLTEASWLDCDEEGTIKSESGGNGVGLRFENHTEADRYFHWIDYEGDRSVSVGARLVEPGVTVGWRTSQWHPHVVTDANAQYLSILMPGNISQTVVIDF